MLVYPRAQDLADAIGLPLDSSPAERPSFNSESDWGYALRGAGCDGGMGRSRWLLTFVTGAPQDVQGHLVAYEISADNVRTGRCALLRSPWTRDLDWTELRRINGSGVWTPLGERGEADLVEVDEALAGPRLG